MADVLDFEVRLKLAEEDIRSLNNQLKGMTHSVEKSGEQMDATFKKVGTAIAAAFSAQQLIGFAQEIVKVRSEIESYEISFRSLLGSQSKGDALFSQIREFAASTTMGVSELAKGAQTLLGFGVQGEKIIPIMKQIGDVSMGNVEKFSSLTLAFAQTASTGKLMGQDLLQMINAGFNPLSEISRSTGKSISQLKEEMSAGAISAEMVAEAFRTATSEGGMFYGMLDEQAKGIAGSINLLQGAWEEALNDIGKRSQGVIVAGLQGATKLVENYDKLIAVILGLVSAYGTYKAAMLATLAIDQAKMFAENIRLVAMFRKELGLLKAAQQAFNLTAIKNPYVLLASAITAVGVAIYSFASRTDKATKAQEEFNKAVGEQSSANVTKIEKMSKAWNELGDDLQAKERYIRDNKSAFEELGVAINSVVEAENLLVANKEKFIEAQQAKARAQLYQEKANELIAKQIENEAKMEELAPYVNRTESRQVGKGQYQTYNVKVKNPKITELEEENKRLQKEIDDLLKKSLREDEQSEMFITDSSKAVVAQQNINDEIKKYTDLIKTTKQELDDLRSGKTESTDYLGDIEAKEKKLEEYEGKLETLKGKIEKITKTTFAQDAEEEAMAMEQENYTTKLQHEAELARVRTANLNEYYKKQQDIIDANYNAKVDAIEKERNLALANAKQENKDEINVAFDKQKEAAEKAWELETQRNTQSQELAIYNQRLEAYKAFANEYVRIEEERKDRTENIRKLAQEKEITEEEAKRRIAISDDIALAEKTALQAEMGLTAEEVTSIVGEVVSTTISYSLDQIKQQLPALKAELKALQDSGADPAKIAKLTAQIETMDNALRRAKTETLNVNETTEEGAQDLESNWRAVAFSMRVVNEAIDDVANAFGDMFGEAGKTAIEIMQTTMQATMGILGAISATSESASASVKAAERASVILAIISAAIQAITAITNAIVKNFSAQAMYEKRMEEYSRKLDEIELKWKKLDFENQQKSGTDYWDAMIDRAREYSTKLKELNGQLEETKRRQDNINAQQANADAQWGWEGDSRDEDIAQAERKRNNTEKELEKTEYEIQGQITDTEKELYELQQKILEEMATTSVEQFGQTMAESIVEGFNNGLDGIKNSFENTIDDLVKSMLTKRLAIQLTDQFEEAFKYLEQATQAESGVLIDDQEMSTFLDMINNARNGALSLSEEYQKLFAELGLLDDTISAESKGFQAMSQDTADELNGRFTALQISGANIDTKLGQALLFSQDIANNIELATQIAQNQLNELRNIARNTALLQETNTRLKQIQDNTARL